MNGISYTTGTVHRAIKKGEGDKARLIQACGAGRRQIAYLHPTTEPVTCRRCA